MARQFERCLPEEVGIPSAAIHAFLDAVENGGFTQMHGLMIMRHGKVCAQGWWAPFAPGVRHCDHSLSKTYTATAVGLAQREGLLRLDDRVCDLLAEKMPPQPQDAVVRMTVRDLLVMGHGAEEERPDYPVDWLETFFRLPVTHAPGTFWRYNSHTTAVLCAIIEKLSGQSLLEFLTPRLFLKIGIDPTNVICRRGADGTCLGGMGMFTTTQDNLRLMKLYLDGGVAGGERLLDEQFVREATSSRMDTMPAHAHTPYIYDNCLGYGYQIWMCRPEGSYRADGAYGQFAVVVPSLDLIVSIHEAGFLGELMGHSDLYRLRGQENHQLHGPQATLNALFDLLVPQIHAGVDSLPAGEAAHRLQERLRRLAVPHPYPAGTDFAGRTLGVTLRPEAQKVSFGVLYPRKRQQIRYPGADVIHLDVRDRMLKITWLEDGQERVLLADMQGSRTQGCLIYTYEREVLTKISTTAWWDEAGALQLSVLWYESEVENRFSFAFDGDRVCVDKWFTFGTFAGLQKERCVYRVSPAEGEEHHGKTV